MATLTGNTVQSTYDSLIKIGDNTNGFATLKQLSDGLGNLMPIEFSSTVVDFTTATTADFTGVSVIGLPAETTYDLTSAQSTNDVNLNLVGSDATTDTVKLVAGTGITLTDNGSNEVTIDGTAQGVTTLEGLSGALLLNGTQNITVTDNGSNTITLTGYDDTPVTTNAGNIAVNGALITANTTNISNLQTQQTLNTNAIATNSTDIQNLQNGVGNVISVNTLDGGLTLAAGSNISVTDNGTDTITVAANLTGFVDTAGTPVANQVAYFTDSDTITGESTFTYNPTGNQLVVENAEVTDTLEVINYFQYTDPIASSVTEAAEICDFGSFPAQPSLGRTYYLSPTFWLGTDNTSVSTTAGLLIVVGNNNVKVKRGLVRNNTYAAFTQGDELYVGTSGVITNVAPTAAGTTVRVVGHCVDGTNGVIYFDPSQDYYTNS